ncbi:MAG: hypothetical protein O8C67_10750 [Candidatus Methanoperedens sp.]|nr:hypothetical protein [Candidatus Methanoperedens sp.]
MTPEAKQAMKTMKCPRCGGRLFVRRVLDDGGLTSKDWLELFDIYGHPFSVKIKDFKEAQCQQKDS